MLYLIGAGFSEKDISLEGVEAARKCECFIETYTSAWGSVEKLERLVGKGVKQLGRPDMEENASKLIEAAKTKDIAVLVPGDPLAATTHINFLIDAKKSGASVKIIHGISIFSAIAETGLQLYKFGKTATVPATGELENLRKIITQNKSIDAHTLLLLDTGMNPADAIKLLLKEGLIKSNEKIITAHLPGEIFYGNPENLAAITVTKLAILIMPASLHFKEKEFLEGLNE